MQFTLSHQKSNYFAVENVSVIALQSIRTIVCHLAIQLIESKYFKGLEQFR
jgi:hypothetical protein